MALINFHHLTCLLIDAFSGLTCVYKPEGSPPKWEAFGQPMRPRPLDSVVLDEGVAQHLVDDVKEFITNSKWFVQIVFRLLLSSHPMRVSRLMTNCSIAFTSQVPGSWYTLSSRLFAAWSTRLRQIELHHGVGRRIAAFYLLT